MNTLLHKTDYLKYDTSLAQFFDPQEFEILVEVLKVMTCQQGQTIYLASDFPVLVVSDQLISGNRSSKEGFTVVLQACENMPTITAVADGIYCTLEPHKMQFLLERHPFLALKLNQIADIRLTSLLVRS